MSRAERTPLESIRRTCLSFPSVSERMSHGAPTFFVKEKKSFATVLAHGHHALTFAHFICAADPGVQGVLVNERPEQFFVPAYVGGRGWIGVRLDRSLSFDEIDDLLERAYRVVAPPTLIAQLDRDQK